MSPSSVSNLRAVLVASLAAGLVLPAGPARAAYPLAVDDAGVHPPGEMQTDLSADALRTPATDALAGNFLLTSGILPRLEGSLGFGHGWTRDRTAAGTPTHDGVLDLTLGFKSPLLTGATAPFALTLSATVKLPTASARLGLGTGATDFTLLAIATRSWGALSLDLNGGFTWTAVGRRAERAGDGWFTGAALRWQAGVNLMLFAETSAVLPTTGAAEPNGTVRAGGQWQFHPGILLGAGAGTGYGPGSAEALATVGLTFVF